ncbi:MAG: hypothetical protein H8E27_13060 [Verrucomicrobia subdivision 3 bacterium]|nr:hypothetical protein [Limisphaerales bacterium]
MNRIIFYPIALCGALLLAAACGDSTPPKPAPPKGGKANSLTAPVNPHKSPEALARKFHESLSANDAIQMMHLSMLGAPTNAWMEFTGKMYQHSSQLLAKNLADLQEAKPREERTDAEQTRIFNLMAQRRQMDLAFTNSLKRLTIELPEMREKFLQRGFLDVVLQFKNAGLDPAQLTVSRVDTSTLTDQYQGIEMHGGPVTVWFAKGATPLNITLTLVLAKVSDHGWVFVQDPKVNLPPVQGPVPEPSP